MSTGVKNSNRSFRVIIKKVALPLKQPFLYEHTSLMLVLCISKIVSINGQSWLILKVESSQARLLVAAEILT